MKIKEIWIKHKELLDTNILYKLLIFLILICLTIIFIEQIGISLQQINSGCTGNINYDNATICYEGITGIRI